MCKFYYAYDLFLLLFFIMKKGVIVKYFDDKGFGFIQEDGRDDDRNGVFFHVKSCVGYDPEDQGNIQPKVGDLVTYEVGEGRDGKPAAVNVSLGGSSDEDSDMSDDGE